MNLAQEIQAEVTNLPIELQTEILDFIKFVKQQRQLNPISQTQGNVQTVLALLHSPTFQQAPTTDPDQLDREIEAHRNAWDD